MTLQAEIEVDVFSGRPNPSFALGEEDARQLKQLLDEAREAATEFSAPPALGFRGYVIRFAPSQEEYRLFGGVIVKGGRAFRDPHREAEEFVRARLPAEIKKFTP